MRKKCVDNQAGVQYNNFCWRNTQEAEEAPLLRVQVGQPARGFESLFLRQAKTADRLSGFLFALLREENNGIYCVSSIINILPIECWRKNKKTSKKALTQRKTNGIIFKLTRERQQKTKRTLITEQQTTTLKISKRNIQNGNQIGRKRRSDANSK